MVKEKKKIKIVCTKCKGNGYVVVYQQPYHDNYESQLKTLYAGADVISH